MMDGRKGNANHDKSSKHHSLRNRLQIVNGRIFRRDLNFSHDILVNVVLKLKNRSTTVKLSPILPTECQIYRNSLPSSLFA